jgi:hypothetical protein
MLSTFINTLQSGLLGSRGYVFGSFLPLLLFFLASLALAGSIFPQFRTYAGEVWAEKTTEAAVAAFLLLMVAAFMFMTINSSLRRLLEGGFRVFPPFYLRSMCLKSELDAAAKAGRRLEEYQRRYFKLASARLVERLKQARLEGSSKPSPAAIGDGLKPAIEALEKRRDRLEDLVLSDFSSPLADLERLLRNHTANDKNRAESVELSRLHIRMVDLVHYAERRLQTLRLEAYNTFAEFPDSIAPTRFGNIAGTLRSYASSRYGLPLDVLWTRFQRILQDDDKLNSTLQDSKVQLDFLVSMTCLSALFVVLWGGILWCYSDSPMAFLCLGALGPLVIHVEYRLACEAYLTFAEVMRSAVDLRRMDLLAALKIPPPATPEEEREVWNRVGSWLGYENPPEGVVYRNKP